MSEMAPSLAEHRFKEGKPFLFFASRMTPQLEPLREAVYEAGQNRQLPIWLAGHSLPELLSQSPEEAQIACMDRVRKAARFVCALDGSYGSPLRISELCVLELEIFSAILSGRRISVFLVEPFDPDPRLGEFLETLRKACPDAIDSNPKPPHEIADIVAACGEQLETPSPPPISLFGRLLQFLARRRTENYSPQNLDVSFLDGQFAPLSGAKVDKDHIETLLRWSAEEEKTPNKLAHLWAAIRALSSAPYDSPRYRDFLPLWNRTLGRWASASAWYGLHGHIFLGRLAAVNTIIDIRGRLVREDSGDEMAIQGTHGSIASEYYSIAKQVPQRRDRRKLLERSLRNVNLALDKEQPDPSGLLAIRGSVRLALGEPRSAIGDYEESLRIRLAREETAGRIGEAEVELAMGYLRGGRAWKARGLLRRGVENLRSSDRHEFLVRALRKLGLFYAVTLQRHRSREALHEALEIATRRELEGQVQQIRREMRRLHIAPDLDQDAVEGGCSPGDIPAPSQKRHEQQPPLGPDP